jgi:hypothetical protein
VPGGPEEAGPAPVLLRIVERGADTSAREWLANILRTIRAGVSADVFHGAFAGTARRLANASFRPMPEEADALSAHGLTVDSWTAARAARTGLLSELGLSMQEPVTLVGRLYRTGDNEERIAVLGALPILEAAELYLDVAVEACRTHVTPVFEAIACDNPYPSRHFTEPAFNQMVLKSLFLGVSVSRITGMRARYNIDLVRMLRAYADERRAAGRGISSDVDWLLDLEVSDS